MGVFVLILVYMIYQSSVLNVYTPVETLWLSQYCISYYHITTVVYFLSLRL